MQIDHLLAALYVRMQEREFGTREWRHRAAARTLRKQRTRTRAWRLRWPTRRFVRAAAAKSQVC